MADPLAFIFGIARNMAKEAIKRHRTMPLAENWDTPAPGESNGGESRTGLQHDCLDRCLRGLSSVDRELILEYYREDGCAKIRHREMMARGLKLSALALRLRIHRVKHRLRECVFHCVDTGIPGQSGLH
jgi:DNA-directed RNA polymerase specialized sigma24 family protein